MATVCYHQKGFLMTCLEILVSSSHRGEKHIFHHGGIIPQVISYSSQIWEQISRLLVSKAGLQMSWTLWVIGRARQIKWLILINIYIIYKKCIFKSISLFWISMNVSLEVQVQDSHKTNLFWERLSPQQPEGLLLCNLPVVSALVTKFR